MGILPLRLVDPGFGASIHYAGTLPFSGEPANGGLRPDGLLYGTKRVYVADASGFTALPAKGVTLSLMANAHGICSKIDAHG